MDSGDIYSILIFFVCVVMSAFFSASETAFTSLRKNKLKNKDDSKSKKALKLHSRYDELLSTILIGNNIVNIASSSIATLLFVKMSPTYGPIISTLVTTVVLLMLGEITPKLIAKIRPEKTASNNAGLLSIIMTILKPFVWLFGIWQKFVISLIPKDTESLISEDELLSYVDDAKTEGSIEHDEHLLVKAAIEFDDYDVSSILIPRVDIIGVDINDTDEEIERVFDEYSYSRIIVYSETIDKIIGIIHEKDFYRYMRKKRIDGEMVNRDSIISDVLFIPGAMIISDLLKLMQREKKHMAVIVDEHGGVEGIATMEDVLEELVGEIWDETDEVETDIQTVVKGKTYLASGKATLEKVFSRIGLTEEEAEEFESNTLSGFIIEILEKIPEVNDSIIYGNYKFIVQSIDSNRIEEVIINLIEE